jgi:hypothetical protein
MKTKAYPKTPELEKMKAVQSESQAIGTFIDALSQRGILLASYDDKDRLWPISKSIEQILADHFKIDLAKVEKERQAILKALQ